MEKKRGEEVEEKIEAETYNSGNAGRKGK